ncbi:MAG TPA: hypothetical protein VM582_04925, partial [Candidatus Thermoplasmatota archaeon]|nr:hypothetical protein [Candidatus Thermoplasmatota archaeon]
DDGTRRTAFGFLDPPRRYLESSNLDGSEAVPSWSLETADGAATLTRRTARVGDGGPLGFLASVHEVLANLTRDGRAPHAAQRVDGGWLVRLERDGAAGPESATLLVQREPPRLLEATVAVTVDPGEGESPVELEASVRYAYDEPPQPVPPALERAIALRFAEEDAPAALPGERAKVRTFQGQGLPLADVEVHVKRPTQDEQDLSDAPTLWTMPLARRAWSQDGVTVLFDDRNGDGRVNEGDTLHVRTPERGREQVVLYDAVTGTYVVPGGVVGALVALAGASLARRRAGRSP